MRLTRRTVLAVIPALVLAGTALVPGDSAAANSSARSAAQPASGEFAIGTRNELKVTMADGVTLRVVEHYPVDRSSGKPALGPFPVLLSQTPYGKESIGVGSGYNPFLVRNGYIDVIADVRGTGDSNGQFGLFDPVQGRDGATLVRWAARLPNSDGRVGLLGASYLGINQFMTAADVGRHSPLKAIFPIVASNDFYRDVFTQGGIPDAELPLLFAATTGGDNVVNPLLEDRDDLARGFNLAVANGSGFFDRVALGMTLNLAAGGDEATEGAFWKARATRRQLRRVVANRIPAFLVGGWYDLFQRGEPLNYAELQNLAEHRPLGTPMQSHQPVTGRYQLLMGPWYHDAGAAGVGVDLNQIELRWFDHWLKHEPTGIAKTRTPMHLAELGTSRYLNAARYPITRAHPTTLYLGAGHTLTAHAPTARGGADNLNYSAASVPCGRSTEQWSGGGLAGLLKVFGASDPCASSDAFGHTGSGGLTYTTAPMRSASVVAGPIAARIYATSTTPNTELVVTLDDIGPGGTSTPITSGALLGSFRAEDSAKSWFTAAGRPLLPYHPYTAGSERPVAVGKVTRYDIEIFPTVARLARGHRLRLTLATSDTPHLLPSLPELGTLLGGQYAVQHRAAAASYLEVPLIEAHAH